MMCLVGGRQSGKTRKLIELSSELNAAIVVSSHLRARQIEKQAADLGIDIPKPKVAHTCAFSSRGRKEKTVLVDEAADILRDAIGASVEVATIDQASFGFYKAPYSLRALLKYWWKLGKARRW